MRIESHNANSTYPKDGVSRSKDSFVFNQTLVLRIHPESFRDGENRHLRQAAKRCGNFKATIQTNLSNYILLLKK
jgi:hypothetical protein